MAEDDDRPIAVQERGIRGSEDKADEQRTRDAARIGCHQGD